MRRTSHTIDLLGIALMVLVVGLLVGFVALTPVSVAVGLLLAKSELSLTWGRG